MMKNKLLKFAFIAIGILLFIIFLLNGYAKENENLEKLIGSKIGGGELSMADYYSIAQCVETYQDYLIKKDYETAYQMLNNNYKQYVSFEEYQDKVSKVDYSQMHIKDIEVITATAFRIDTDVSGEEYSVILNHEKTGFLLLPHSFLDYQKTNLKTSKKSLKSVLTDYLVNTNECVFHFEVTNTGSQEIKISSGMLYTNLEDQIESSVEESISPKETKQIAVSFDTDYAFPKKVVLFRQIEGKDDIEYVFEIKEK